MAEWHERKYSEDELAPHYALLAHHWARADDPDKAVTYLERAGRQALRSGAFREALLFLTDALEVEGATPDPIRDAMCQKGLGTAHYFVGDFERSRACLELAIARLAAPFPTTRRGIARGLAREAAVQAAHLVRPARYLGRRRGRPEQIAEALGCYKILGQIGYLEGDPTPTLLYGTLAGLNLGEEGGPSPDLARMLIHAATASSIVGLQAQADRYAERAIAMVDAGAQREASAYVWNVWAVIHAHRGDWARAEKANATALERLGEVGDFNLEAEVWQMRAAICICSGAFGAAESAWSRHRELAERKRNPQNLCWSLLDEAETRVGRDEVDAAAAALDAALAIPTAPNDGSSTIEKHYATAMVRRPRAATPRRSRRPTRSSRSSRASRRRPSTTSTSAPARWASTSTRSRTAAAIAPRCCAGRGAAASSCAAPPASSGACARAACCWRACWPGSRTARAGARGWRRAEAIAVSMGSATSARGRGTRSRATAARAQREALAARGGDVRAARGAAMLRPCARRRRRTK